MSVVSTTTHTLALDQRQLFLQWMFERVGQWSYVFLKYPYQTLSDIPDTADVDLLILPAELPKWKKLLSWASGVAKVRHHDRSYASYYRFFFEDGSYLELDLIHQIKWRRWEYLPVAELIARGSLNEEGIRVGKVTDAFSYVLGFYMLNGASVPQKYQKWFAQLPDALQAEIRETIVQRYQIEEARTLNLFEMGHYQGHLQSQVKAQRINRGVKGGKQKLNWVKDQFRPHVQPTITFSGVDGAGKSTILELTQTLLEEKYRQQVVMLRQRPSILPILSSFKYGKAGAESRAANTLPRQGTNKSRLSSLVRFAYYLVDYLLGQQWVHWRVNRRAKVLLYDRYYFDFIVDSRRANLSLPSRFTRVFYRWIKKPSLNILLYADPEVIIARKQELSEADIRTLTQNFRQLFTELSEKDVHNRSIYLPIHNLKIDETMELIETQICKVLQ